MGWTESPPAFLAVTETIADIVNNRLETITSIPKAHLFEGLTSTSVPLQSLTATNSYPILDTGPKWPPLAYVDVYVDNFVKLAQGWTNAMRVRRHTFQAIDEMFCSNDHLNHNGKEPISQKKLQKGDDFWSTQKVVLWWLINTATMTISLPPHWRERLLAILTTILIRKRASMKEWHCLLGELHSMSLALPGSVRSFSILQTAIDPHKLRVKITEPLWDQLKDLHWLVEELSSRPTHLAEVVPTLSTYLGTVNAAKPGMGGIWFPPVTLPLAIQHPTSSQLHTPILWRARFPAVVCSELVSFDNPTGSITNSDLELAGAITHNDILIHNLPPSSSSPFLLQFLR